MPKPKKEKEAETYSQHYDPKVVTLRKKTVQVQKPKSIPGVSSSVRYDEGTDTITVTKFPKGFGKAVRVAREKQSMTQKQLAMKVNKQVQTILAIEKEDAVYDGDLLLRLEAALQVKFDAKYKL